MPVKATYRLATMSDVKPKIEGASRSNYRKPNFTHKTTSFSAPTSGLEDVIFDYGPSMKQGRFKTNVELLAEFMSWTGYYKGHQEPHSSHFYTP